MVERGTDKRDGQEGRGGKRASMEVVEQLDYLVTNAEVMHLLRDIDDEATIAGFKRPPIARETSTKVNSEFNQ